jgi:hypothetical protein
MLDHRLTQDIPIVLSEIAGPVFGSRCFGYVKGRLEEFRSALMLVADHTFV